MRSFYVKRSLALLAVLTVAWVVHESVQGASGNYPPVKPPLVYSKPYAIVELIRDKKEDAEYLLAFPIDVSWNLGMMHRREGKFPIVNIIRDDHEEFCKHALKRSNDLTLSWQLSHIPQCVPKVPKKE